jgi:hypothetical protein
MASCQSSTSPCYRPFTLGQHNKPRPATGFRAEFVRVVAVLIGTLLLVVAYYNPFGGGYGGTGLEAYSAMFGLLFIVVPIRYWVRDWKRSNRK